jgi:hypothetical protein
MEKNLSQKLMFDYNESDSQNIGTIFINKEKFLELLSLGVINSLEKHLQL